MNIFVFGCSWTVGIPRSHSISQRGDAVSLPCKEDYSSWASELAKMFPEHHITNYAIPSSDITFSIAMLNHVLENKKYDKIVFKVTSPFRFTYWDNMNLDTLQTTIGNYTRFAEKGSKYITPLNINDMYNDYSPSDKKFIEGWYERNNLQRELNMHKSLVDYATRHSDFCYGHYIAEHLDCPSVEEEIGTDKFKSYICDLGWHFGDEGNRWEAEWIAKKINL